MASLNLSKALPILVVEKGDDLTQCINNILAQKQRSRWNAFDTKRVDSVEEAKKIVGEPDLQQPLHWAAVVYDNKQLNGNMSHIARIRRADPFMPQIMVSKGGEAITEQLRIQAVNTGVKYSMEGISENAQAFEDLAGKLFRVPSPIQRGKIIKIGGSALDYDRQREYDPSLAMYCHIISKLAQNQIPNPLSKKQKMQEHRIICTVGAGQLGEVIKDYQKKYGLWRNKSPELSFLSGNLVGDELDEMFTKHKTALRKILSGIETGGIEDLRLWEISAETYAESVERYVEEDLSRRYQEGEALWTGRVTPITELEDKVKRERQTVRKALHLAKLKQENPWLAEFINRRYVNSSYPELIAEVLMTNLKMIHGIFTPERSSLIGPGAFYFISNSNKKTPLIAMAPHYILVRDEIPLQDSDTHTIALAEFYGIEKVILIKRTDGIYKYDPYRGFELSSKTVYRAAMDKWKEAQKENELFPVVGLEEMISGKLFSREGTGPDGHADGTVGHLIEDSALEYMAGCRHVKEVLIVPIAPEELYIPGSNRREAMHIVTQETKKRETDPVKSVISSYTERKNLLEQALAGKARSVIVREKVE
ncbi:MAG TPA: hypothetical protein VJB08_02760 [Candidatus Nanoarchaeia archaeon]|nr:hypothetical protein [Candidatus Nanoarchaeia archaeon]